MITPSKPRSQSGDLRKVAFDFDLAALTCDIFIRMKDEAFKKQDIKEKAIAIPVLTHRIVLNYKAEANGFDIEKIIKKLF